jgi:hypothetical protein
MMPIDTDNLTTWNYESPGWPAAGEWIIAGFRNHTGRVAYPPSIHPISEDVSFAYRTVRYGALEKSRLYVVCRRTTVRLDGTKGYVFETPDGIRFFFETEPGSAEYLGSAQLTVVP